MKLKRFDNFFTFQNLQFDNEHAKYFDDNNHTLYEYCIINRKFKYTQKYC